MRAYKIQFGRGMVVAGHEQVRLVFVGSRIGSRLASLRQASKVKLVGISLAVYFCHDVLVIVVSQCTAQLIVVHVRLGFALAPASGNFIRIRKLELPVCAFPCDAVRVGTIGEELQEELPELDLSTSCNEKITLITHRIVISYFGSYLISFSEDRQLKS